MLWWYERICSYCHNKILQVGDEYVIDDNDNDDDNDDNDENETTNTDCGNNDNINNNNGYYKGICNQVVAASSTHSNSYTNDRKRSDVDDSNDGDDLVGRIIISIKYIKC